MVYACVRQSQAEGHRVIVVRHEDLSRDPMNEFLVLHERLGLTITDQTRATIALFSTPLNPKETTVEPPHVVRLDSRANLDNWKKRLTLKEIERIGATFPRSITQISSSNCLRLPSARRRPRRITGVGDHPPR
jgi:hypothetical protein